MIDKKKIKAAAKAYEKEVNAECKKLNDKLSYSKNEFSFTYKSPDACFADGAKWAIKEFKKSLWHDASEEPEKNKFIIEKIFEENGYDYELDCPTYSCRTWVEMVKIFDIIKWCYLDDILPQKGGSDV